MRKLALAFLLSMVPVTAMAGQTCMNTEGETAVRLCTEALAQFSGNKAVETLVRRNRAYRLIDLKRYREALEDLDIVIASGLTQADDYFYRGVSLSWLDQNDAALKDYETAHRLIPGRTDILSEIYWLQDGIGRHAEAAATAGKLLAIEETADFRARRGWAFYRLQSYTLAEDDYTRAIVLDGTKAAYWYERGFVREAMFRYKDAEKDYTKAIQSDPRNASYRNARGEVLTVLGEFDAAHHDFATALEQGENSRTRLARAKLYMVQDKPDLAKEDAEVASADAELRDPAEIILARVLAKEDQTEAAIERINKLIEKSGPANGAYFWRGDIHINAEKYSAAVADITVHLASVPNDEVAYYQRAVALFEMGKTDDAMTDLNKALEIDPGYLAALEKRAQVHNWNEDYERAIADTSAVIASDNNRPIAYYRRAYAQWGSDKLQEALADYSRALTLLPDFSAAYSERSNVLADLGRFEEAHRDIKKALEFAPEIAINHRRLAYVLETEGKYQEALAAYDKAIALDPKDGWGFEGRGWAYLALERWAEALSDCTETLRLMPNAPASYRCLARSELEIGNADVALGHLRHALSIHPDYGPAHFDIANILYDRGEYESARDSYTRCIQLNYRRDRALIYRGDTLSQMNDRAQARKDYLTASRSKLRQEAEIADRRLNSLRGGAAFARDNEYPQDHGARAKQ
jgi:tetratricopeptide (TPR) repeat protein